MVKALRSFATRRMDYLAPKPTRRHLPKIFTFTTLRNLKIRTMTECLRRQFKAVFSKLCSVRFDRCSVKKKNEKHKKIIVFFNQI